MDTAVFDVGMSLIETGYLARLFQDKPRIDPSAVPANAEEQMWSRGAARGSDAAQTMAFLDFLTGRDIDVRKMEIHANETVAMIDEHGVTLKK
jgi:hypothetical protein